MTNAKTWQDIFYETTAEELVYSVRYLGNDIFYGRAVKSPSAATLRINISKICRDWVEAQVPSFTDGVYQGLNYGVFDLVSDEGTVLSQYGFLFNWDYEDVWDGLSFVMSKPINGRADSRMIMLYSVFEDTTGNTVCREEEFIKKLRIIPSYIEVSNTGITRTITVESNYDYSVTVDEPWLHISPLSGEKGKTVFTLTVDENALAEERYGTIHFDDSILTVYQKAAPVIIEVNPTEFDFTSSASASTFVVSANTDYTVSADVPWITINANSGGTGQTVFTFTIDENRGNGRNGHILINGKPRIDVSQSKYSYFVISPSALTYGYEPDSQQITITANTDYDITTNVPWIHISQNSGESGVTVITVTVDRNTGDERTGKIYIGNEEVQVTQNKFVPVLIVSPTSMIFTSSGETQIISVTANTDYPVSVNQPWLQASRNSVSSGITTIDISTTSDTKARRKAVVTIGDKQVEVMQYYAGGVNDYLTMEIVSGGTVGYYLQNSQNIPEVEYSINGGEWTKINSTAFTDTIELTFQTIYYGNRITVQEGDIVRWRGYNDTYYEGSNNQYNAGFHLDNYHRDTATYILYGNLGSLVYGSGITGNTVSIRQYGFRSLFESANVLDATGLVLLPISQDNPSDEDTDKNGWNQYEGMFANCDKLVYPPYKITSEIVRTGGVSSCAMMFMGCTSLVEMPILETTNLEGHCFYRMFAGCTSLVYAHPIPLTKIFVSACEEMFLGCTSLVNAPEIANAQIVSNLDGENCFKNMFAGCTSLVNPPSKLSFSKAVPWSFSYMFSGCTSLTKSPEINIAELDEFSMVQMFINCQNLTYIKCLATSINADATINWAYGVSPTGMFVKAAGATWSSGANGIPSGWSVENA